MELELTHQNMYVHHVEGPLRDVDIAINAGNSEL